MSRFYDSLPANSPLRLDKPVSMADKLDAHEKLVKSWGDDSGVRFGIHNLDVAIGGLYCGEVLVLVGGTGSMKTSLALSAVENFILRDRGRILFISVDMSDDDIRNRLILREALDELSENDLKKSSTFSRQIYREARTAVERVYGKTLVIESHVGDKRLNLDKMKWLVDREIPDLVVIDYLTMLNAEGKSDLEFVSQAMRDIHAKAQKLKIPFLVLSQMSRTSKAEQFSGKTGGHARGGGIVEELSTVEIELRREEQEGQKAEIYGTVTKTRRGIADKTFLLDYKGRSIRFTGIADPAERVTTRKSVFKKAEGLF